MNKAIAIIIIIIFYFYAISITVSLRKEENIIIRIIPIVLGLLTTGLLALLLITN